MAHFCEFVKDIIFYGKYYEMNEVIMLPFLK